MIDPGALLLGALLVGLLCLDQTAVGQVMVSQPLVGGWILGVFFGRPVEGLVAGTLLQLLCLTELPVGASIPPDGPLAGLTGTALFILFPRPPGWSEASALGLSVLLFIPLSLIGRQGEIIVRRVNSRWTQAAVAGLRRGDCGAVQRAALGGITFFFAKAFILSLSTLLLFSAWYGAGTPGAAAAALPLEAAARLAPFAALGVAASRQGLRLTGFAAALGLIAGVVLCWRYV